MNDTRFNRKDWMRIPEGFPAELIRGELVREPAPSLWHQVIVMRLARMLEQVVGPDRVIASPISVFLGEAMRRVHSRSSDPTCSGGCYTAPRWRPL